MPVNEPLNYEVAVFREDVQALAELFIAGATERLGSLDGEKMKVCIVAAALMTAADLLDNPDADEMPDLTKFKDNGVVEALAKMVAGRFAKR